MQVLYSLSRSDKHFYFIKFTIIKRSHINTPNSMVNSCVPLVKRERLLFLKKIVINMSLYNPTVHQAFCGFS